LICISFMLMSFSAIWTSSFEKVLISLLPISLLDH
jgi:hypothetical protein